MVKNRRCAQCQVETGVKRDGSFTPYTLHPFASAAVRGESIDLVAAFCTTCFDELGTRTARDQVAMSGSPVRLRAVTA